MTNVFATSRRDNGSAGETDHEQVIFCQDTPTGLRAIIGIYSTALGPGLGGTRFYPYASEGEALTDVLRLSKAMAYKNALAGLDHGGGKAVIIGDPARMKTEALLRAYGRFVTSLGGRYITACDVGTRSEDMDIIARESRYVTGRTTAHGGAGRLLGPHRTRRHCTGCRRRPSTPGAAPACVAGPWAWKASGRSATGSSTTSSRPGLRW